MPRANDLQELEFNATAAGALVGTAVPAIMRRKYYYGQFTNLAGGAATLTLRQGAPPAGVVKTVRFAVADQVIELPEGAHVEDSLPFLKLHAGEQLYAITSAGTAQVKLLYEDTY